jgi:hypothetical protein
MIKRSLLVILLLFAFVSVAWGATYYVDTAADPGGDGTNQYLTGPHCAFKTIAQVKAAFFSPGDSILFKRGCTWREKLSITWSGSAGSPITFGVYGSGAKPVISGADIISSWTDNGSNTWKATVTTQPNQVMFKNVLGTKVGSAAECNSDKKWYWASNLLYTYGTQDPNITYPNQIEASQRDICIDITASMNYIRIDNICTEKSNLGTFGAVVFGYQVNNATVQNSESRWNYGSGYFIYADAAGDIKLLNNSSHDNGSYGIAGYQHAGASAGHEVIISGNEVYNNRQLGGVGEGIMIFANYYIVEHNNVHDNGHLNGDCIGIHIYTENTSYGQNNIIRYNTISGQIGNNYDGAGIETDHYAGLSGTNQIYYNIIFNNHGPAIDIYGASANVYNNVCYNNLQNHANNIVTNSEILITNHGNIPGAVVTLKNNIAFAAQANTYAVWFDAYTIANGTLSITNNDFYDTSQSNWYSYNGTPGNNLTTFNGFTGFGSNLNTDPLTKDPANGDYSLQATSSCINAGVSVGLTQDFYGNPVPTGSAPDIGAVEYDLVTGLGVQIAQKKRLSPHCAVIKAFPLFSCSFWVIEF